MKIVARRFLDLLSRLRKEIQSGKPNKKQAESSGYTPFQNKIPLKKFDSRHCIFLKHFELHKLGSEAFIAAPGRYRKVEDEKEE